MSLRERRGSRGAAHSPPCGAARGNATLAMNRGYGLCDSCACRAGGLTFFRSAARGPHVPARLTPEPAEHEARKRRANKRPRVGCCEELAGALYQLAFGFWREYAILMRTVPAGLSVTSMTVSASTEGHGVVRLLI